MLSYHISFESPWYLTLLALVPLLWWWSFRSLAALGRGRRLTAILLRSVVLVLLILAMAEVRMVRLSDRLTVIYLLDQSLSIPAQRRRAMIEYVNGAIRKHRKNKDRVGVIVFGRDAAIEIPPFDDDVQMAPMIESLLDPGYTNLAGAMKLAQASFPEDAAKRIVILSDGNENLGDAAEQGRGLSASGVGVDVMPIRYSDRAEVIVERLVMPADVRRGQPFDLKAVLTNTTQPTAERTGTVKGRWVLSQLVGDRSVVLGEEQVSLPPGKKVFSIRQQIDNPDFYTYEARFIPDRPEDDAMPQNNRATAFTHIRGRGRVLVIEDYENRGQFDQFVRALGRQNLEVTVQPSNQLFASLAELQPFDTVVLADVPRSTNQQVSFTDSQIEMLVRNTQQMGAGLVMLGGPNSFGAGGWTNTELEKAMPVDFQIKSAKVVPTGALMLVIDASSSMTGQKIEMSKAAAIAAVRVLGPRDYVGVVAFNSTARWVVRIRPARSPGAIARRIARLSASGGTNLHPGLMQGYTALSRVEAAVKHMIVLTDGQTHGSDYPALARQIRGKNITISSVAVGTDAAVPLLEAIAAGGGGKFYRVTNPRALPRIFMKEARRVARPLVYESKVGIRPQVKYPHEMIGRIDSFPPINGFVLTSRKDNPLVEVALVSPKPVGERNCTILAGWTYGLGKTVAFTSDTGARWTTQWTNWKNYDKLFGQIVRWSMRPVDRSGKFAVATDVEGGRVRVVVTALDKDDEFLNFLNITATAVGPDLKPVDLRMSQTAPGRYVGDFPADNSGSYFILISPGAGQAPIRTGVSVPYSDEFRDREANEALLSELARMIPKGGSAGLVIEAPEGSQTIEPLLAVNTFRHDLPKATSSQDVWYYLVLVAGCLFFFDVFVRRVQVGFAWVPALVGRVRGRRKQPAQTETIERLQSRKAEVTDQLDQLRAGARFETPSETTTDVEIPTGRPAAKPAITPEEKPEEDSYTERLLRAKKQVWKNRKS